jgi:opacity protein-like surface antigen
MANKLVSKIAMAAFAGAALSVAALGSTAQAAVVTYDFSFTLPSTLTGGAENSVGLGSFSFDDAPVDAGQGFQSLQALDPTFTVNFGNGTSKTFVAANSRFPVTVDFFSGQFAGIAFPVLASALRGTPLSTLGINELQVDVTDRSFNQATVSLQPDSTVGGYTLRTGGGSAVPTPALLPGLIGMGVAALRKKQSEKSA